MASVLAGEWAPTFHNLEGRPMIHIYGESKTGKSHITRDIMCTLQKTIPQILVVAPTNEQNHDYDANGEVPSVFIHSKVDGAVLCRMWKRQEAARSAYNRANKPEVIARLAHMTGDPQFIDSSAKIRHLLKSADEDEKIVLETALHRISKAVIAKHRTTLKKAKLSKDELCAIKYLAFNPRILLIFDDCTDELKREKSNIMEKLFYQGRHNLITTIMSCHTDKTFSPELKKQTFLSIFTAPEAAMAYFTRASTCLDKAGKTIANSATNEAFIPGNRFQKLVIDRPRKMYFRYQARPSVVVRFGSREVRQYSKKIKRPDDEAIQGNEYSAMFN